MKNCNRCKEEKPLEAFSKYHRSPDGLQPRCKACDLVVQREMRQRRNERKPLRAEAIVSKVCPGCDQDLLVRAFSKNNNTTDGLQWQCKSCTGADRTKRIYGITDAQFAQMVSDQDGLCAICGNILDLDSNDNSTNIDHCHTTNEIRGLLCRLCNMGLGYFKDDPKRLRQAATYVEEGSYGIARNR